MPCGVRSGTLSLYQALHQACRAAMHEKSSQLWFGMIRFANVARLDFPAARLKPRPAVKTLLHRFRTEPPRASAKHRLARTWPVVVSQDHAVLAFQSCR